MRVQQPTIVLSLALVFGLVAGAGAQDWAGAERAQGIVVDEADQPISGATVILRYELGEQGGPKPLATNKKGRWSTIGLRPGPWSIEVTAAGYIGRQDRFTVFETGANETVTSVLAEVPEEVKDAERRSQANELLERGNELVADDKHAEARALFEQVLGLIPESEHAPILAGIAGSHLKEGNAEKGNELLERAFAIDPDDPSALRLKIAALAAEGKDEEAQAYLERLPAEAGLDPNAELNLGVKRYNDGDLDGAGAIFERVRKAHPEIADAHYFCGLVYLGKGDNAAALAAFQEVLRLEPEYSRAAEVRDFISFLAPAGEEGAAAE